MADFDYKVSFLFGAGAEVSFGCPTGVDFTYQTLFFRKTALYSPLKDFYSKSSNEINKNFECHTIFSSIKNQDFRKAAALSIKNNKNLKAKLGLKPKSKITDKDIDRIFTAITKSNRTEEDKQIAELFDYKTAIESLFYSLIDPFKHKEDYYKIVTFYWKAFFSVVDPIVRKHKKNFVGILDGKVGSKNYYYSVFENLPGFLNKLNGIIVHKKNLNKYKYNIIKHFSTEGVLTTNYTSLVKNFILNDNVCYLASQLEMFENPFKKTVFSVIDNNEKLEDAFPFIMGPSNIKPIIDIYQIEQYSKAIQSLKQSDVLIILGHSLGNQDDHIIHLISKFLKKDKIVIYCKYSNFNDENMPELLEKIKTCRCGVVSFSNETSNNELVSLIKQKIEELKQ